MPLVHTPKRPRTSPAILSQRAKASRTVSPVCSQNTDDELFVSQTPTKKISRPVRPRAINKPKPKGVQGIIDSLADPESALIRAIANALKPHIVNAINSEVSRHISQIRKLTAEVREKDIIIEELDTRLDEVESYMRRDCLVVSGIPEPTDPNQRENTDQLIIDLAKNKLNVEIDPKDISRSHRVPGGPPRPDSGIRPRGVIVKFTSYNVRRRVFSARRELKNFPDKIYINEALTRRRSELAYKARQLVKEHVFKQTWTSDCKILIRKNDETVHAIRSMKELDQLKMNP